MNPLHALSKIGESDTQDLRALAVSLGCDPAYFYIGTDLTGVEIRGQDLRGMRFDGTNLPLANLDPATVFDDDIAGILSNFKAKRYLEISEDLLHLTEEFFSRDRFPSRGWFIKEIVPPAAKAIATNSGAWASAIKRSPELSGMFASSKRSRIELILNIYDYDAGFLVGKEFGGRGSSLTALIVVGLMLLIGYDPKGDLKPLSRDALLHEYHLFPQNHGAYMTPRPAPFLKALDMVLN